MTRALIQAIGQGSDPAGLTPYRNRRWSNGGRPAGSDPIETA